MAKRKTEDRRITTVIQREPHRTEVGLIRVVTENELIVIDSDVSMPTVKVTKLFHNGYNEGIGLVLNEVKSYLTNFARLGDDCLEYEFLIRTKRII
jgi:hypothetical protein